MRARDGTGPATLISLLAGLAEDDPDVHVADRNAALSTDDGTNRTGAWASHLLVATISAYAVLSLINTVVIATSERRREFALQRLVGATRSQILQVVGVEAIITAAGGVILGAAMSAATLVPFALALNGRPWPNGSGSIYPVVVAAVTTLTVLSMVLTTAYLLRNTPARAAAIPD